MTNKETKNEDKKKNEFILISELMKKSASKNWDDAKKEWVLDFIFMEEGQTCLCEHYPITENCVIKNLVNGNVEIVGNCCITKITGDDTSKKLFQALRSNRINIHVIDYAFKKNIINDWEFKFLKDVWRRRKKTIKQKLKYDYLKDKIFENVKTKKGDRSE